MKDITGFRFNNLTAIEYIGKNTSNIHKWLCRCDCGNTKIVSLNNLKSSQVKSCGCLLANKTQKTKNDRLDKESLLNLTFGKLLVVEFISKSKSGNIWLCKCSCGNERQVRATLLKTGTVKQCKNCSLIEKGNKSLYISKIKRFNNINYLKWKIEIIKKCNNICQKCLIENEDLEAHHLYSYNLYENLRLNIDNGVALCKGCHKEFHKFYGYLHNTAKQYFEWRNKIV